MGLGRISLAFGNSDNLDLSPLATVSEVESSCFLFHCFIDFLSNVSAQIVPFSKLASPGNLISSSLSFVL